MRIFSIKIAILFIMTIVASNLSAQAISYSYDASGNRILRKVISLGGFRSEQVKDSTKVEQATYTDAIGDLNIHIYPNPTHGLLNIQMNNMPEDGLAQIKVMDINGRILFDKTASSTTSVDLSSQPSGSYILKIVFNNQTSSWKIIKQ